MSKTRWVVEGRFDTIKRCPVSGKTRYKGYLVCMLSILWRLWCIICIVPLASL
ncbi:MAG: hypothetical protein ACMUEL_03460 [Flavobacteriales bacterium Tduv]